MSVTIIYPMMGSELAITTEDRDLGVIVESVSKSIGSIWSCALKGNRTLEISRKAQNITVLLYKPMGHPHLEHCVQVWLPHLKKALVV